MSRRADRRSRRRTGKKLLSLYRTYYAFACSMPLSLFFCLARYLLLPPGTCCTLPPYQQEDPVKD